MTSSPTARGWRCVWYDPALVLGEIVWRWTFGLTVLLVLTLAVTVYLSTIEVPVAALWLISTREPAAIAAAVFCMLRNSGWAATRISLIALPPLGVLWIAAAAVGRAATLQAMLGEDRENPQRVRWRGLIGLNFLRFSLWLAANIGCAGVLVVAFTSTGDAGFSLFSFMAVSSVVLVMWAGLNWLLSVAGIFAVRDKANAFEAISLAMDLTSRHFSQVVSTSSAWAMARGVAFTAEIFLLVGVVSFSGRVAPGFLLVGALVVTLAYLSFGDLLYMGRLASYVAIIEAGDEPSSGTPIASVAMEYPPDIDLSNLSPEHPA